MDVENCENKKWRNGVEASLKKTDQDGTDEVIQEINDQYCKRLSGQEISKHKADNKKKLFISL